jgi:pyruvate/2-oxoglutarate dehydrogenase complex dihydrolipoamide acyltransferase (E2) component
MRFLTRGIVGLLFLAATIGLLVASGLTLSDAIKTRLAGAKPVGVAEERVFTASVRRIEPAPIIPNLIAYGEVRAQRTLELRSPASGTVIWISDQFEDGRSVTAGQPLLRLDPANAKTARDLAASDLARVEAEEAEAKRGVAIAMDELAASESQSALRRLAVTRQRGLLDRGAGSDAAVEATELAASVAELDVLSRRAALSQASTKVDLTATATERQRITLAEAERALADTELRAEFSGVLNGIAVAEGGTLSSGERIGELIDPAALELSFRVSTTQFGQLVDPEGRLLALPVTATLEAGTTALVSKGRLSRVGAAVGEGQTGRLIYAELEGSPAFRPGDFVTVTVAQPVLENAALLPATAIGPDSSVLALDSANRLQDIPVDVLRSQGDDVIVNAIPLAGRDVVIDSSPLLGAGIKVRPVRSDDAVATSGPVMVELSGERRAALIAMVEADLDLPAADKTRLLDQLAQDSIPDTIIKRLEHRAGG